MSYITFDNGIRIETEETVQAVDNCITMKQATITIQGRSYIATDVKIDLNSGTFSYPRPNSEERTTWSTHLPTGGNPTMNALQALDPSRKGTIKA